MRYTAWVARVFFAMADASRATPDFGLPVVGTALGFPGLDWEAFVAREAVAGALVNAAHDLAAAGLIEFKNVDHGNRLTPDGRDVAAHGMDALWEFYFDVPLSEHDRTFLARLYGYSFTEGDGWSDLQFVSVADAYSETVEPSNGGYQHVVRHTEFLGDLVRKRMLRPRSAVMGSDSYRPTYAAAVVLTEADPRDRGRQAGVIDWSVPTPGFETIEERLADLKLLLAGAATDDELSDVGRRCRDIAADAVDVAFRRLATPEADSVASRQDTDARLREYLAARMPGHDFEAYRAFTRKALALANARTHSARTGRATAIAAAQGLLSFVRALQAIERSPAVVSTSTRPNDER